MTELTFSEFFYYLAWGFFGIALSLSVQQFKSYPEIKREGGFSLGYFIRNNAKRFFGTMLFMVAGILFTEKFSGHEISEWEAVMAGFNTDKIVDAFTNRKK